MCHTMVSCMTTKLTRTPQPFRNGVGRRCFNAKVEVFFCKFAVVKCHYLVGFLPLRLAIANVERMTQFVQLCVKQSSSLMNQMRLWKVTSDVMDGMQIGSQPHRRNWSVTVRRRVTWRIRKTLLICSSMTSYDCDCGQLAFFTSDILKLWLLGCPFQSLLFRLLLIHPVSGLIPAIARSPQESRGLR